MVARSGVIFLVSMADILTNPVEICFSSFTMTSTTLAAVTSPTVSMKAPATSVDTPISSKKSKTHPPKPYDIVQGMERVIDMMEETLQIFERA
jgi:glycine cleavage system protein P-like pyridoxal-binding family